LGGDHKGGGCVQPPFLQPVAFLCRGLNTEGSSSMGNYLDLFNVGALIFISRNPRTGMLFRFHVCTSRCTPPPK